MNSHFVSSSILGMALVAVAVVPTSARAQGADKPAVAQSQSQSQGAKVAPTGANKSMALAPVSIQSSNAFSEFESVGRTKAQMGVGLASIVLGIIIGGDIGTIFVVGGSVLGLIGLYNYMR